MSHTMNIVTEVRDSDILATTCQKLGVNYLGHGTFKLFDREVTGMGIKFQNWQLPVVFDHGGKAYYDDYRGYWGNNADLTNLIAHYACEKAKAGAKANNIFSYNETEDDQFITLTLSLD
jgi:hypothetical protein